MQKVFLKIPQNSQENPVPTSRFQKSCRPQGCNFIKKESLTQVLFCEFCEIFKNSFFKGHLWWLLLYFEVLLVLSFWFFLVEGYLLPLIFTLI